MHSILLTLRSSDRGGNRVPGHAARPTDVRPADDESIASIDMRTDWPTHRIRWCLSLSLTKPIESRGTR